LQKSPIACTFALPAELAPSNNDPSTMPTLEMLPKQASAADGTTLTYQVSRGQGPWIVLANGLGGRHNVWRHQVAYLHDHYRFLTWDYRGLFLSGTDDEPALIRGDLVDVFAGDLASMLRAEGITSAVWLGWSIGAQVMLEALRRAEVRPSHLILLNPCYGRRPSNRGLLRKLYPLALDGFGPAVSLLDRLSQRAATWPETVSWAKRLGLVSPSADEETLAEVAMAFGQVFVPNYMRALRAVSTHRVDGILGAVDVPSLVIVGERDPVTPRAIAEPLARQLSDAEVFVIRGATHFALLEFPELINLRIEKFLREHGV
jgi:pimeloyl-ACP methyl ester carboxylesterase